MMSGIMKFAVDTNTREVHMIKSFKPFPLRNGIEMNQGTIKDKN